MLQRLCGINYYTYQLQPSFLLFLSFPNSFFPLGFLTKILYTVLISSIFATPSDYFILLDMITLTVLDKQYKLRSSLHFLFLGLNGFKSLCSQVH